MKIFYLFWRLSEVNKYFEAPHARLHPSPEAAEATAVLRLPR